MKRRVPDSPQCLWCDEDGVRLDKDHVFPRALGGTRELWVPSCRSCQTLLSRLETEASRQSNYSLFCITHGPRGRNKRKPESGVIRARYLLTKNPLGGYGEAAIRAGAETPEALPHIEIDLTGQGGARVRGPSAASVRRLVAVLLGMLNRKPNPQGFLCELEVRTDRLPEIESDPDFWPRIVLDLSGRIYLRVRNPDEALRFVNALIIGLNAGAFSKEFSGWTNTQITSGSPHWLGLAYDKFVGRRVAGKIACGLMFLEFGSVVKAESGFRRVREFVLGNQADGQASPVTQILDAGTERPWNENHVALTCVEHGVLLGVVSIYGDCQIVDFGPHSGPLLPDETKLAMCRWDGTLTRMVTAASVPDVVAELRSHARYKFRGLGAM